LTRVVGRAAAATTINCKYTHTEKNTLREGALLADYTFAHEIDQIQLAIRNSI
jgi:hypothetical protein